LMDLQGPAAAVSDTNEISSSQDTPATTELVDIVLEGENQKPGKSGDSDEKTDTEASDATETENHGHEEDTQETRAGDEDGFVDLPPELEENLVDAINSAKSLLERGIDLEPVNFSFTSEMTDLKTENEILKSEVEFLELMLAQAMFQFQQEKIKNNPSTIIEEKGKQFDRNVEQAICDAITLSKKAMYKTEGLLFGDEEKAKTTRKAATMDSTGPQSGGCRENVENGACGGGCADSASVEPAVAGSVAAHAEVFRSWFQPKKNKGKTPTDSTAEEPPQEPSNSASH